MRLQRTGKIFICALGVMLWVVFKCLYATIIKAAFAVFTPFWVIKLCVHPKFMVSLVNLFIVSTTPNNMYSKCLYFCFDKLYHNFKFCVIN